uniref:Uncharacterized protein n=1 Tax=Chenopodium quinoa TaxID=63459 RepID=A0A803NF49_CHEQI
QAIADFFADHPVPPEWEIFVDLLGEAMFNIEILPPWEMYFYGAARHDGAGAGILDKFDTVRLNHVPRSANKMAYMLAGLAATLALGAEETMYVPVCNRWVVAPKEYEVEDEEVKEVDMITVFQIDKEDWRQPIIDYLDHQKLPNDPRPRIEIRRRASRFILFKGTLYRQSFD